MATRRLFVGLMACTDAQLAIAAHAARWDWPSNTQLTPPERMHLTLTFLGDVGETDEARLHLHLARVPMDPIDLRLTSVELFNNSIAVLRPEQSRTLELLHGEIATQIEAMKLGPDRTPWKPHITLARNASGATPPVEFPAVEFNSLRFSLVCSRPEWALRYEIVESWPAR